MKTNKKTTSEKMEKVRLHEVVLAEVTRQHEPNYEYQSVEYETLLSTKPNTPTQHKHVLSVKSAYLFLLT